MKSVRLAWIIALNTMREILRDRVLYGLVLFAVSLIFLSLLLGELSFAEQARIVTDMGLAAVVLGCGMLSVFIGGSLVWREIDRQTVLTLLSKPVRRDVFILGKVLGLGIVILLVDVLVSVFLAAVCYFYGLTFWSQFVVAQVGVVFESLVLVSLAVFFGTFARPVLVTTFTLFLWLLGHGANDLAYFAEKSKNQAFKIFGTAIARVLPNFERFNFREAVIYGDPIAFETLLRALAYAASWVIVLHIASVWIFRRRDFI